MAPRITTNLLLVSSVLIVGIGFLHLSQSPIYSAQRVSGLRFIAPSPCAQSVKEETVVSGDADKKCQTQIKYIPSDFETAWLQNVGKWQHDFCPNAKASEHVQPIQTWLSTLKGLNGKSSASNSTLDSKVFSRFVTTSTCSDEVVTWIEPLTHGLRHPNAHCGMGADVMDTSYLLLSYMDEVSKLRAAGPPCKNRSCQNIFFDLGATVWSTTHGAGQAWFVNSYQRRGIEFDRLLLWEVKSIDPPTRVYDGLPKDLVHKYQYFNMPATTDISRADHPVRILKQIAQPGDFVAFKLDIDNGPVEQAILDALASDRDALALVDEFFFEYHVLFDQMVGSWTMGGLDPNKTLQDSFKMFHELRERGVRAHSWV